jgi:hypothetical protein
MRHVSGLLLAMVGAALAAGCSSGSGSAAAPAVDVLDPTQSHYGHTDSEWGALWWQWVYQLPQTSATNCVIPFQDPTGANCGAGQAADGYDVFFLAGTSEGTVVRDMCQVPAGKALFVPILTFSGDNAGVPPAQQLSNADLQAALQSQLDGVTVSSLEAEFDGVSIPNLGSYKSQVTQFMYTLPPEPNVYTCGGAPGVTGTVNPSYAAGYYFILAPPAPGAHTLHFAGKSPLTMPPLSVDVTYNFTIQ